MTIETPARTTLANVEILRFVAALLVLVEHLFQSFERGYVRSGPVELAIPLLWRSGVDLFFVISGFIMLYVANDEFGKPGAPIQFLKRRIVRVVPMYWLFTTLMLVAIGAFPGRINNSTVDPLHVVASYAFIPWPRPDGALQPILGPGWTLNYEMLFYVAFALALCLRRAAGLVLLASLFVGAIAIGLVAGPSLGPLRFWCHPMILEFVFGVILAQAYLRGIRLAAPARLLVIALGVALGSIAQISDFPFFWRWLWAGGPAVLIAAGVILGPEMRDSPLRRLLMIGGAASYALYLSHLFSLKAAGIIWDRLGISSSLGFMAVAGIVALLAAVAIHFIIEKPLIRVSRRLAFPGPERRLSPR